jgi:RTX calcium-binding nonapeptide repeat (4 copies)
MVVSIKRIVFAAVAAAVMGVLIAAMMGGPEPSDAALLERGGGAQVVIGKDDDNTDNPTIQPPGTAANQSLNNTDVLSSGAGNDVLIGLLGSDVMQGEEDHDILVGGTEQFTPPNSDVMFGDTGNDTSVWAPGDGSDAFLGASGLDAQVFGVIDRNANNVPTLSGAYSEFPNGVPKAEVTGSPGFCTLERIGAANSLNYDYLVRFFVRSTGDLAVTIRLEDTEQVFCTSEEGGAITFANLTQDTPRFREVSRSRVNELNPIVWRIIR